MRYLVLMKRKWIFLRVDEWSRKIEDEYMFDFAINL